MRLRLPLLLLCLAPPAIAHAQRATGEPPAPVSVELDSSYRRVIVTVGPFRIPAGMAMDHDDPMMMAMMQDSCIAQFTWPRSALFHELRLELLDARGDPLPRRLLHHLMLNNFDRRELVYPRMERIVGFGQETDNLSVPATIGMPMARGHRVALVVMWDNETGHDIDSVRMRLTFRLNPRRQSPPPIAVLPFMADVALVLGGPNVFDVPPGGVTRAVEFTVPVSGRLLAVGGHLHDHGTWVKLEDAATNHEIATVHANTDRDGRVVGMSRKVLALLGPGPHLRAGHRYRLTVRYENPTNATLVGMMGLMGGLFAPDDLRDWPAVDHSSPEYQTDLAGIHGARLVP